MIRRPPRSTQSRSSAASDVYKRQILGVVVVIAVASIAAVCTSCLWSSSSGRTYSDEGCVVVADSSPTASTGATISATTPSAQYDSRCSNSELKSVSYTHLRAHETVLDLVCRLLLEKKK
eukprot:TRINITY_DN3448_c0_g1_i1.p1 TRINITY_DN3448_c0_g1~~TRINITY_DN3448_c0_g1_i1.p1  ORF type:complete len:120 (-),score=44.13 TRINITY_DN3448_c0_g1_i1:44-403(-)